MSDHESTREPTEDQMSDGALSVSVLDADEEAAFMEEVRREREEAARRYRCCICGRIYTHAEGQLLWHTSPYFLHVLRIFPVTEELQRAEILHEDEHGNHCVCICGTCQRTSRTTPSRSSEELSLIHI